LILLTVTTVVNLLASSPAGPAGSPVLAVSQRLTFPEMTAVLAKHLNIPITYRQRPTGEMKAEYGEFGQIFESMYGYFGEFGFSGPIKYKGAYDLGVDGPLTTWEKFVRGQNWEGFLMADEA
jgi:hypothetical protein